MTQKCELDKKAKEEELEEVEEEEEDEKECIKWNSSCGNPKNQNDQKQMNP